MRSEKPQSDNSAQVDDREGGSVDQSKGDKELEDATGPLQRDLQGAAGPPQQEELPRQQLPTSVPDNPTAMNRYHYQSSLSSFVIIYHHFRSGKKRGRTGALSPESGIY